MAQRALKNMLILGTLLVSALAKHEEPMFVIERLQFQLEDMKLRYLEDCQPIIISVDPPL